MSHKIKQDTLVEGTVSVKSQLLLSGTRVIAKDGSLYLQRKSASDSIFFSGTESESGNTNTIARFTPNGKLVLQAQGSPAAERAVNSSIRADVNGAILVDQSVYTNTQVFLVLSGGSTSTSCNGLVRYYSIHTKGSDPDESGNNYIPISLSTPPNSSFFRKMSIVIDGVVDEFEGDVPFSVAISGSGINEVFSFDNANVPYWRSKVLDFSWNPEESIWEYQPNHSTKAVTLNASSFSIDLPHYAITGDTVTVFAAQNALGNNNFIYSSTTKFPEGDEPVLSTAPYAVDLLRFVWGRGGWNLVDFKKNYS